MALPQKSRLRTFGVPNGLAGVVLTRVYVLGMREQGASVTVKAVVCIGLVHRYQSFEVRSRAPGVRAMFICVRVIISK